MRCMWIQIKFDIDINNDELLKAIWKHKKKRKKLIILVGHTKPKLDDC
jgi:hypothetical protein